eukprot:2234369-Prorocentrum_lima.AAC.1
MRRRRLARQNSTVLLGTLSCPYRTAGSGPATRALPEGDACTHTTVDRGAPAPAHILDSLTTHHRASPSLTA